MQDRLEAARQAWRQGDIDSVFALVNAALGAGDARPELIELFGDALLKSGQAAEAAEAYGVAAERAGERAFPYWKKSALARQDIGDRDGAYIAAIKAQKLHDGDPDMIFLLAQEFHARGETEMLDHFKNRLTASDNPKHLEFAAELISAEGRNPFNLALFRKLAALNPDDDFTQCKLMTLAREFCDYETIIAQEKWLARQLARHGDKVFEAETPYANLLHCSDERQNGMATNRPQVGRPWTPSMSAARRSLMHKWGKRLKIGYFSSDFGSTHATMRLMRDVLERHDPKSFDITLYCYTPEDLVSRDDGGRAHWGRIVRVAGMSDADVVTRMKADGVDILVDLKGHTGGSRSHILNFPIAPLQVAWLGFPGSTQLIDVDYIIGDRFVLPEHAKAHYHEKFVRMPDSYQPNDARHRPIVSAASRADLGLPHDKFIFASFNANRKISLETVKLWAKVLTRIPESLLWVMIENDKAQTYFAEHLERLGVAADRLIFCANADYPDHLARVQAADLCLDTFPYNGHTTTSDMLWAGAPVITRKGSNFASRVSESLLNAIGMEELVAEDEDAFVALAMALSNHPDRLKMLRARLVSARPTAPLFDSTTFCRALERGYVTMADRAKAGLGPEHFDIV
jgi:predicted O-linked N-acetylglucosamine transferase (SPINDLY family)